MKSSRFFYIHTKPLFRSIDESLAGIIIEVRIVDSRSLVCVQSSNSGNKTESTINNKSS